jgi:hypothetical protein
VAEERAEEPIMAEPVSATASPEPVTHVIPIHFDEPTHALNILREGIAIKPGDTVVWTFANAPAGYTPWVQFRNEDGSSSLFGPLASLHQTGSAVWGTCPEEQAPGAFSYRAVLQKGHLRAWDHDGSSLWSRTSGLAVVPPTTGEERGFTVTMDAATQKLTVSPEYLEIRGQDTVLWSFPPEAAGWLPRVTFFQYQGDGVVPNAQLGPFTSLITQPGEVRGTGNTDVQGLYYFEVALVAVGTGELAWVNSSDPVVDNRGTVIGPDG